jgi:parallel beta-helix repeat protein
MTGSYQSIRAKVEQRSYSISSAMKIKTHILLLLAALLYSACSGAEQEFVAEPPSLQEMLITAQPGDTIRIGSGTFSFTRPLSLFDIENVTISGEGMDETVLDFKNQVEGAEGLLVKADRVTIENLTISDTKGDGIKVQDSDGVTIRNVRVNWSGGPSELNGAYGLYPVSSRNILIEYSEVSGASDAGIYVGQSEDVVVRKNRVFENVAGIEIENCIRAKVYDNDVRNNTGGILVFDLPGLMLKNGREIQIFNNLVIENNHPNFAPEGNIVGMVPAGTGILVMATDQVEVFDNEITNHSTANTTVLSYLITQLEFTDSEYNPFPSAVFIYDNNYSRNPALPDTTRMMGQVLAGLFESDVPDIIHDGLFNPSNLQDGQLQNRDNQICIDYNSAASFANINALSNFNEPLINPDYYRCDPVVFEQLRSAHIGL